VPAGGACGLQVCRNLCAAPDPAQEKLFFALVRECPESGVITEDRLREEIAQGHLRRDAPRRRAKCAVE
jgi:hypothetical protein